MSVTLLHVSVKKLHSTALIFIVKIVRCVLSHLKTCRIKILKLHQMLYFIAFYQFYENAYNFAYSICEISDNVDKMSQSLYLFVKNRNLVDLHPIQL